MVSVSRRGRSFNLGTAVIAAAIVVLGLGSSANAQIHGVQIGKSCTSPRCVNSTTDCLILVGHGDGFGDTIQINQAFDVIEPTGVNVRVPVAGNLPIVSIEGNAFCTNSGGVCQSNGTNCALPCRVGPAGSTLSGLPGQPLPGAIRFRSNTYVIQPTDMNPLRDQANVDVQDLCDSATTQGCSNISNLVQFTASTIWCNAADNNACTTDTCTNGVCSNTPITCNDTNACTTDTCNPQTGCVFTPNAPCNDSNACTTDTCVPATGCVFTPNAPCNDNNACTTDTCSPTAPGNGCVFTPNAPCNDNNACTTDTCSPATGCVFTPNAPCNDNNACTTDTCSPATGCVFTPNAPCTDNNACTTDTCNPVTGCVFTPNAPCNDFNACTTDTCNPTSGCVFTPHAPCNDNNACTNDTCSPTAPGDGCVFTPHTCNDFNPCTEDTCVPTAPGDGCVYTPNCVTPADCEERPCQVASCDAGCCTYSPLVCPPGPSPCEFNQCNPATNQCEITGVNCDDGDECTNDICDGVSGCRHETIACCHPDCEPVTKAHFDIWNENERKLSGTYRCIAAWDQELLSRYTPNGLGNNLLRPNLQTDKGKARIDGLQSQQCEENCFRDPKSGEPIPLEDIFNLFGGPVDVTCTESAPLLGVAAKVLTFPGASERAGSELVGMGNEAGSIAYDLTSTPPPAAAAGVVTPDNFVKATRSTTRGGTSTLLTPEQGASPAAGAGGTDEGIGRGAITQKGSLLVFPKVEIKWDATGNVIQDTFVQLTNDYFTEVTVQMYFVHGDLCTWVDNAFVLTPDQSVYWSVLTGQPIGASPFTALEERCPDDDPENPGGTRMRGYILAWAVEQATNREIRFNHLSGKAMLINYRDVTAWEYNPWAFLATEQVAHGAVLYPPYGKLDVDGREYQFAPDQLLLDFFASGAMINPGGIGTISLDTDLTLWVFDADLRENAGAPFPEQP